MAIEDELKTCPACEGEGMVDGAKCEECHGRGITRVLGPALVIPEIDDAPDDEGDGLDGASLATLREMAEAAGLSPDGGREALIKRIRKGEADPPAIEEDDAPEDGLDKLTVAQLRERADELGVDSGGRKAELLALIRGAIATGAAADGAPAEDAPVG
jgi:hypothetical protein